MKDNRQSANRYFFFLGRALVAVIFAAACLTLPIAPAIAGGLNANPPSVTVVFDRTKVEAPSYAEELRVRLQNAAAEVCGNADMHGGPSQSDVNRCVDKSLSKAIHDVDSPMLTGIHRQSRAGVLCTAANH